MALSMFYLYLKPKLNLNLAISTFIHTFKAKFD